MPTPEQRGRARLGHLLTEIASNAPAPASGSAAAAVVATSAALLQKVALRSRSRWPGATAAHHRAEALRLRAEELIELDSLAYLEFVEASRSGQNVDAARQKTIDVPIEIAGVAAQVMELAHDLETNGNPNLRADAAAAAILAEAAQKTAAMLIQVNIASASPRRPAAPGPADGPDRARAQSRDSDPPSRPRDARDDRSALSAGRSRGSARSRSASSGSPSTRQARRRGGSR
ncbi:MAG: cyclodeaminase/cyclohydrolase family protein [Chloroflexi bacterium]|nr:MAG: cyclodeaminase/cyclohydrolase family protein [Chloroflexota bacterium]